MVVVLVVLVVAAVAAVAMAVAAQRRSSLRRELGAITHVLKGGIESLTSHPTTHALLPPRCMQVGWGG